MKKVIAVLATIATLYACGNAENGKSDATKATEETPGTSTMKQEATYKYDANGDKVMLHLILDGTKASGHLTYEISGKDKNDGTFEGVIRDSLLIADYTFRSEGTLSYRQVAFKISGNTAIEGYGEIEQKDGKIIFVDASKLSFDHNMVLQQQ
ncbi:hypothetical protein [Gynurincola endophyticus]|uniref:hypothetical protein n=1 Tax=Gynurincola endophyticus TaxID=2479004 RepID=UPI000F8DCC38|nr:hypothetical protein [Gynurincola endophyticus]